MPNFSVVAIVYNPNSTGPSEHEAQQLGEGLRNASFSAEVRLIATEHPRHAEELAYDIAMQHERPLIVSSSGDGGYNEVVNGAMRAQAEGANPVCAVLAAGNANDHSRTVVQRPLLDAILSDEVVRIDVLKAVIRSKAGDGMRYAHSYIGLGLTPAVAVELNRSKLNRVKEGYIVYKALRDLQPVVIEVDGKPISIDSLVLANISQMAKVLTIAGNAAPDDGLLRVTVFPYRRKIRLIFVLLKAIVNGIHGVSTTHYEFTAVKEMVIQFDGEVQELAAGDSVAVRVEASALATLR